MNKCIKLLCIICIIGCSENRSPEYNTSSKMEDAAPTSTTITIEDAYTLLITEKLQDYIDTQKITKNHPDFKQQGIHSVPILHPQDSVLKITILDKISTREFDSLELKTVISYYNSTKKDTIISKIERTKIIIEGEEITSSKVTFRDYK